MAAWGGRSGHALALAVLVLLPLIFLWQMAIGGREPDAPDTQAARPLSTWARAEEQALDQVPLWCPGIFSGMPSYGSFIYTPSSSFDITRWLRQPFGNNRGMRYYVSLLLGAAALYGLLALRRAPPPAALIGTLAFVMTPYFFGLIAAGHSTKLQTLYLAPLVFLAIELLLARRGLATAAVLAVAIALQLWNNHPQISYYTLLLGGLYLGLVLLFDHPPGWRRRGLIAGLALAALATVAGLGLVMDPYAAVMEYTPYSIRGGTGELAQEEAGGGAGWQYATGWSFPPEEVVSFLFPAWYGLEGRLYWGRLPFTQSTHYFGITILLLALAGVAMGKGRRRWILLGLAGFIVIVGFGRYFPALYGPMYALLPYFSRFRIPSMIYSLLPLFMGMLSAYGVQALLAAPPAPPAGGRKEAAQAPAAQGAERSRVRRAERASSRAKAAAGPPASGRAWRWLLLVIPLLLLWLLLQDAITAALLKAGAFIKEGEGAGLPPGELSRRAAERARLLWGTVALGLLLAGLTAAVFEGRRRRLLSGWVAASALVGLVVADLWIVDRKFYHPVARAQTEAVLKEDELVRFLRGGEPPFRIAPLTAQEFASNRYAAFGLESVGGYQPAKLRIYDDLISSRVIFRLPVLSMLNVQYLISDASLAEAGLPLLTTVAGADGQPLFVHRNPLMLPRAWFVEEVRTAPDARTLLAALADPGFDPARTAWIYAAEAGLLPDSLSRGEVRFMDEGERLLPFDYTTREIRLPVRVAGPRPGLLVLSEIHYPPGWRATVDDQPVAITRANHVLRALWVPPGDHEVRLVAQSRAHALGIRVSRASAAIVLLMLAGGLWAGVRRRRTREEGAA